MAISENKRKYIGIFENLFYIDHTSYYKLISAIKDVIELENKPDSGTIKMYLQTFRNRIDAARDKRSIKTGRMFEKIREAMIRDLNDCL